METPFVNLHSHTVSQESGVVKITNLEWNQSVPEKGLFSLGIHPWLFESDTFDGDKALEELSKKVQLSNVVAIGEAGIDKCHPISILRQTVFFERQISLSEQVGKPLIIHAVRSYGEVLSAHKKHRPSQQWIVHGFNGSAETARQLTDNGIFLSIGDKLLQVETKIYKSLINICLENIFLETDVSKCSIVDMYECAASILDLSVERLKERIFANFARCFKT